MISFIPLSVNVSIMTNRQPVDHGVFEELMENPQMKNMAKLWTVDPNA